jgi:hypothetical protein
MSIRIDLDFRHGLTVPEVSRTPEGVIALSLTRGSERAVIQLSLPSLEALSFEVMTALTRLRRC